MDLLERMNEMKLMVSLFSVTTCSNCIDYHSFTTNSSKSLIKIVFKD
jgi:hypothetical protein